MTYDELRKKTNVGWNTWYSSSMLSHVLLPYCLSVNLGFYSPIEKKVINNLKEDDYSLRPEEHSWNGEYTRLSLIIDGTKITVESASKDEEQIIIVSPDNKSGNGLKLKVDLSMLWNRPGKIYFEDGQLTTGFEDEKVIKLFVPGSQKESESGVVVGLNQQVVISTFPVSTEKAVELIDKAKSTLAEEDKEFGEESESYRAMRTCLAWNTVFDPEKDRIMSPVNRKWSEWHRGYILFEWDTYFAAMMCSLGNRELAYLNAFAITNEATEEGMVPNFAASNGIKSRDRSQPPVGSMVVSKLWERFHDKWFVKEITPALFKWNSWFWNNRRLPDGTLCWGSNYFVSKSGAKIETTDIGNLQGARYESGLDNSPMYDDANFDEKSEKMLLSDVGLTGLYIQDCRCLIELASVVGNDEWATVLTDRLNETENALESLWNPEDGIYENRYAVTGQFSDSISPTNLYCLYSKRVSEERQIEMSGRYIMNPQELGGKYMLPSISRSNKAFADQNYWRGRIWPPMNYLVWEALGVHNMQTEMGALAESSREILLREWDEHCHVHENYSGIDGSGCGARNSSTFYHWGGLLGYISIMQKNNRKKLSSE